MILNYTNQYTSNASDIEEECRGLVLEEGTWDIVAKPFTRFYKTGIKRELKDIDLQKSLIQSKEDGTLIIMYYYKGTWRVNCIQNYADDTLPFNNMMTYKELFESILGTPLSYLSPDELDINSTYLFEMCSVHNRVVRKYEPARLFLLTIIKKMEDNHYQELTISEIDDCAKYLGVFRPQVFEFENHNDITKYLRIKEKTDITFEGFVINFEGERFKQKNYSYLMLHRLRFRNWVAATPKVLGGFVRNKQIKILLNHVEEFDTNIDEVIYAINMIRHGIKKDPRYHEPIFCDHIVCYGNAIEDMINEDNDGIALEWPKQSEIHNIDGENKWHVVCTCGSDMDLVRMKRDHVVPSMCHCGKRVGYYKIRTGRIAYLCSNCGNTHEAHQDDIKYTNEDKLRLKGEPLGIPCSKLGKIFRLHLHSIFDLLWRNKIMDKNIAYEYLADKMGINRENAHVARFGIRECIKAIELIQSDFDWAKKS